MLSSTPWLRGMYELGPPPTEPSLSWIAAAFQATPFRLSLPHLRSIGGKYTGLALTNFARSMEFSVLTPALVYIKYESAPVLRVALSWKFTKVTFSTLCR